MGRTGSATELNEQFIVPGEPSIGLKSPHLAVIPMLPRGRHSVVHVDGERQPCSTASLCQRHQGKRDVVTAITEDLTRLIVRTSAIPDTARGSARAALID
jgi:hypothetical protein